MKLRQVFKHKRNIFDKSLWKYERKYKREKVNNIENLNTTNPQEFWKHIKELGPQNKQKFPIKVRTENSFSTN